MNIHDKVSGSREYKYDYNQLNTIHNIKGIIILFYMWYKLCYFILSRNVNLKSIFN